MNRYLFLLVFGMGILLGLVFATSQAVRPVLQFPTGAASWTVIVKEINKIENAPSEDNKPITVIAISTVQDAKHRRDIFTWSNKHMTQNWISDGYVLTEDRYNNAIYAARRSEAQIPQEEILFNAEFFAWTRNGLDPISSDYNGKKCLLFRKGTNTLSDAVYVDSETLLPIAFISANSAYEFSFDQSFLPVPPMPGDFSAKLKKIIKANTPPVILNRDMSFP